MKLRDNNGFIHDIWVDIYVWFLVWNTVYSWYSNIKESFKEGIEDKMSNRQAYYRELSDIAKQRLKENQCPNCGKPKEEWERRKDWTCCSVECTENYYKEHDKSYSWQDFRYKIFTRDDSTCKMCNKRFVKKGITIPEVPDESQLIADHIVPIELDGQMWNMKNIQTLCIECNKIKTKEDMGNIAVHRKRFKNKMQEFHSDRVDKIRMVNVSLLEKWF